MAKAKNSPPTAEEISFRERKVELKIS